MQRFGVLAALAAFGLAGCSSSSSVVGGNSGASPVHNAIFGAPAQPSAKDAMQDIQPEDCPRIEVRDGTNVYRLGGENAMDVRYQATLTDVARECTMVGSQIQIKVGIEGKVIVGPRGGAGTVSVPVRISLLTDLNGKTVASKFRAVPVTLGANDSSTSFAFVEAGFTVSASSPEQLRDYIFFVGFDPKGGGGEGRARRPKRR